MNDNIRAALGSIGDAINAVQEIEALATERADLDDRIGAAHAALAEATRQLSALPARNETATRARVYDQADTGHAVERLRGCRMTVGDVVRQIEADNGIHGKNGALIRLKLIDAQLELVARQIYLAGGMPSVARLVVARLELADQTIAEALRLDPEGGVSDPRLVVREHVAHARGMLEALLVMTGNEPAPDQGATPALEFGAGESWGGDRG